LTGARSTSAYLAATEYSLEDAGYIPSFSAMLQDVGDSPFYSIVMGDPWRMVPTDYAAPSTPHKPLGLCPTVIIWEAS